jgi:glycerol kinase
LNTILAVDQSTSGTKALLFDLAGNLIDQAMLEHRQIYPVPGWVEQDVEEIYANTLKVIGILLERNPDAKNNLLAVSLTNQRETFVVFEKTSGKPLYNAIVWQCRRGAEICDRLVKDGYSEIIHQKTGLMIDTYFSAPKIRWLVEQKPEMGQMLESGEALVGTIDTYLIYRLTHGHVHATDFTNASRTLLFDIGKLNWDADLCTLFKVPAHILPEVRESTDLFGETDLGGLIDRAIPICGVMGDSQASLFAQGCFSPGMVKVTFGTGSSLLLNIGKDLIYSNKGIVSTIAFVYQGQPTYAFEGIINFSAATISWLKNQLKLISSSAETESLAMEVEDNGGVYLVPAFVGLSAPYWRPNAKAAITGLTPYCTRNHIVRAALESIAYQVKDVLSLMSDEAGLPLVLIHADGGAARNRFLTQFTADMVGFPVQVPEFTELSALGAVFCAYLGFGKAASLDDLTGLTSIACQYEPKMAPERVNELYAGWQEAVKRVL